MSAIKKKILLISIVCLYGVVLICATLYVPVKATILDGDNSYTELGYYPIWEIGKYNSNPPGNQGEDPGPGITMRLNITAWIIQYIFISAVFASLFYRTRKHFF